MYDNAYNRDVCNTISGITKRMINHENELNDNNDHEHKITTRLEGMALRKKNVHGGSGYAAATVGDHGFKEDATRGAGVSAAGVSAAGVSAAGLRTKKGVQAGSTNAVIGGDLSLLHYNELKGQPALRAPAISKETVSAGPRSSQRRLATKADMPAAYSAGAKPTQPNARNEIVRRIMREKSLSLPLASKYVKEHSLYTRSSH